MPEVDKEIVLAIINGPGAGLTCIVLGVFVLIAFLVSVGWAREDGYRRGQEEARDKDLQNIQVTLARLVSDNEQKSRTFSG